MSLASLASLEAKVEAQCKEMSYDLDNNLAVLKLYQFHPHKSNTAVIARILIKAREPQPPQLHAAAALGTPAEALPGRGYWERA